MNSIFALCLFLVSFVFTLFSPYLLPFLKITYFAPFLALTVQKNPLPKAMSQALIVGFLLDLLSVESSIGFWMINYLLATYVIHSFKAFFFEEKISSLPLLALFFSQTSTAVFFIQNVLFNHGALPSLKTFFIEFGVLPASDALFTLFFFSLPLFYLRHLTHKARKQSTDFRLTD